jgi:hypothetical protein
MATNNADNFSGALPGVLTVSNGGPGRPLYTAYAPICGGSISTSAFQPADTGLSNTNRVLVSQGASQFPVWSVAKDFAYLGTQTISGSVTTVTFDSSYINSVYSAYFFVLQNIIQSASSSISFRITTDPGGATTFISSGYQSGYLFSSYNSSTKTNGNSTSSCILLTNPSASSDSFNGYFYMTVPANNKFSYFGRIYRSESTSLTSFCYGRNTTTSTVTGIQFSVSAANMTSGSFSIYGIKT